MAPTQEFKTELLLNAAGYYVHQDPSPILFILPTDRLAESFSTDRLQPMIEETPELAGIAPPPKTRSTDNKLQRKAFSNGAVIDLVGANSPTELASRPKRIILADEIDKFPASAGKEGAPLKLGEKRTSTFWNAKSIRACSPTQKGFSNVGREYELSDQRRPFVRCPHCNTAQILTFDRIKWDKDENGNHMPETAEYECRGCGSLLNETDRRAAVAGIVEEDDFGYRQTKPFRCCGEDHKPLDWLGDEHWTPTGEVLCPTCGRQPIPIDHYGANPSRLVSLTVSMPDIVTEFLEAKDDPELLKVFVNTTLSELWEEGGVALDSSALLARRETYSEDDMPEGVLVLTAAVDVQDNRLELDIVGWGVGEESWGIKHEVIIGDPALDSVWHALEEWLLRSYRRADGRQMRIQCTVIDSGGHHTEKVYEFTTPRWGRRVYAIKGDGGPGKPIWPKRFSRSRTQHSLFMIGTNAASDQVYSALRVKKPGAGYCHFAADYDIQYFDQLLAEKLIKKRVNGQDVRAYECPKGVRNEAHDLRRYNVAALKALPRKLPKAPIPTAPSDETTSETQAAQAAPTPPRQRKKKRRRRGVNDGGGSWL